MPDDQPPVTWGNPNQPSQQPGWGPPTQPQPSWGRQPPQPIAPQKPKRGKAGCLGCAGILAVAVIIGVAANAGSNSKTASVTPTATKAAVRPAPTTQAPAAAPTQPPAPAAPATTAPATQDAAPQTILTLSGSGIKNTAQFTTGDAWTVSYTYDCSAFGGTGNFIVSDEDGMPLVNELDAKGSGSSPQYKGGTHHLEINSECKWTVKVTNG